MNVWGYAILSSVIVSVISLVGIFTLSLKINQLKKIVFYLISFSAGALLGDAFLHLIPHSLEGGFHTSTAFLILFGVLFMFFIEKIIHWRHCHEPTCESHPHPFAIMNIVGDVIHNLIDGLIIGASYLVNIPLGIATTLAVVFHEVPQEIGDFGVLIHGGFSKGKAIFYNFLTALTAIVGVVLALLIGSKVGSLAHLLIPFAAGSFIYIAASDLIPEMHKEQRFWRGLLQLGLIVLGILVMFGLLLLE
ncbi:ZIP family metal transporter [Candidatus Woesearchaeota archaeon]|jgi:zinc and cadmium transporter|nr:ZIP family metal transporter [Candidatus Woesearchaeota archaeon]MBT4368577.1 ZIP family metal transporter [Candidatus Woesearchaeota archaeon]MBT4713114.1 ZIP family metal transporter [Candidatus Woesearchaeota archaeon]MBT6639036.1 ZIP family metal transporter [Candidatus Woesearchaeota archaeon]MBT7134235.1 ZIP family metal transporter [Candidatus Woesearchaeota archaeon]